MMYYPGSSIQKQAIALLTLLAKDTARSGIALKTSMAFTGSPNELECDVEDNETFYSIFYGPPTDFPESCR